MENEIIREEELNAEEEILEAEEDTPTEEAPACPAKERLLRKCEEVKTTCRNAANRIARDLKETDFDPYLKTTQTARVEIYRKGDDETPVDVLEYENTNKFSARTMVAVGAATLLVGGITKVICKKLFH